MRADITKTSTEPFQGPKKTIFTSELLLPLSWNMNCHFFSFFFFNFFQFFAFLYENLRNFYTRFFTFRILGCDVATLLFTGTQLGGGQPGQLPPPSALFLFHLPPPLRFLEKLYFIYWWYLIPNKYFKFLREAAKKVLFFLVVRPLRRGGGKGPTTKEKRTFKKIFIYFCPKVIL